MRGGNYMDTNKIAINDKALESIKKMQEIASAASSAINLEQVRDSLLKMSERISLSVKNNWVQDMDLINQSLQTSLRNFSHTVAQFQSIYDMEIMRQSISEMAKTLSNMQTEQLKALSQIDFKQLYSQVDCKSKTFDDIVDLAYEATITEVGEVPLSKEELKETIIETKAKGTTWKNFNIQLYDSLDKFKREHCILHIILTVLLVYFFAPWFADEIGKPVMSKTISFVKELPDKGSEIICRLEQNVEAIIIENQNYYYKVYFIDENGIEREGYVAKKNLKIIDPDEDSDEQLTVSGNDSLDEN